MSRIAQKNCRWCGDRPGGCLYCVGELPANDPEKRDALFELIQRGDVAVIEIQATERYLVHHIKGIVNGHFVAGENDARGHAEATARAQSGTREGVCATQGHRWEIDATNLRRRRCTRPGCAAVQVWRWLPESKEKNGEWTDPVEGIRSRKKVRASSRPNLGVAKLLQKKK
jgi:hypothetical protein